MFLPPPLAWNSRYLATGNGGIDGCIKYEDIAYGLSHGFASTGSNNGHNGTGGADFLNNEDVVIDFSYRASHTASVAGKKLIEEFYGQPPRRSYYIGCSGGGRQGIQAADMFPEDYDGILVGAPALNFNYMSAWRASFYTITGDANSTEFITQDVWQGMIHDEVLRQCDTLDGVKDGILVDPKRCAKAFRPEALLCTQGQNSSCLTSHQVSVVQKVFSPLYDLDELIYPGLAPGAELRATERLLSGTSFPYSVDWFRYAVYSDPHWDPASFTIRDARATEIKNPGNARTWPSNLSFFRNRGGKLLIYHGESDQQITHFNTERWYDFLNRSSSVLDDELDRFMRFFRIPGMGHCSGGVGAWQIGQSASGAKGLGYNADKNVLASLVEWVEHGMEPEALLGTKFVGDDVGKGVEFQQKHCR